jgi:predicted ATPase
MIVSRVIVKNWRNFRVVDVPLQERQFLVGPNACGKSNFLDLFRFLRDIANPDGGGLQKAIKQRGGLSKIRSLAARKDPEISIEIHLGESTENDPTWRYSLGIAQQTRGHRQTYLTHERVWKGKKQILNRPLEEDNKDDARLSQTYLEQINVNSQFREIVKFLQNTTYLHLVPQVLRNPENFHGNLIENDPFGQSFLERIAATPEATQRKRLQRIEEALKLAVPQLENLEFQRDDITGRPHLQALYNHWRPNAGRQREDQFSDGTLRFIGLFWSLLESNGLLLLEEPELSLNDGIVKHLAALMSRMQRFRERQILVSTHSEALLSDKGIDAREILLFQPDKEGTTVKAAFEQADILALLEAGYSAGEVVLPRTAPRNAAMLSHIHG